MKIADSLRSNTRCDHGEFSLGWRIQSAIAGWTNRTYRTQDRFQQLRLHDSLLTEVEFNQFLCKLTLVVNVSTVFRPTEYFQAARARSLVPGEYYPEAHEVKTKVHFQQLTQLEKRSMKILNELQERKIKIIFFVRGHLAEVIELLKECGHLAPEVWSNIDDTAGQIARLTSDQIFLLDDSIYSTSSLSGIFLDGLVDVKRTMLMYHTGLGLGFGPKE